MKSTLMEYILEEHTHRRETKTQLAIKAYRYKKAILGVTYSMVADKFACSQRMIKNVNKLYVLMSENGYDANEVFDTLMSSMVCKPVIFEWLSEPTSSIGKLVDEFRNYIEYKEKDEYDSTTHEKVKDSEGKYYIREIAKKMVKEVNDYKTLYTNAQKELSERDNLILKLKEQLAQAT